MNVVEHRAPLKRIDFGLKPRAPEPQDVVSEATRTLRELGALIEQQRIWSHVRRTAEGCNPGSVVE